MLFERSPRRPDRSYGRFGFVVKELLLDQQRSMRSLADEIGIDIAYIVRLGHGQAPSMKVLHRVADALGLPPEYFAEYRQAVVRDFLTDYPHVVEEIYERLPDKWLKGKKNELAAEANRS